MRRGSKQHARGTHGQRDTPPSAVATPPHDTEAGKQARTAGRGTGQDGRQPKNERLRGTELQATNRPRREETPAQQAAPSYDKQGGEKGETTQDSTRAARGARPPRNRDERSKQTAPIG